MQRCLICYARLNEQQDCQRCGAQLHHLFSIEQQSRSLLLAALYHLNLHEINLAGTLALQSNALCNSTLAMALMKYCDLMSNV